MTENQLRIFGEIDRLWAAGHDPEAMALSASYFESCASEAEADALIEWQLAGVRAAEARLAQTVARGRVN